MDVMKAVESLQSDLWGVWFLIGAALLERYPMQCARVEDVLRKLAEG